MSIISMGYAGWIYFRYFFDIFEKSNIDIFEISIFIENIDIPQQPNLYAI